MATEPLSLMEFVHTLLADAQLRAGFADDPRATLQAHGLEGLSPADVHDALDLVQENEITDFHPTPPWDVDSEAFGHGGAGAPAADGFAWSGPAGGSWTDWTPSEHAEPPSEDGWSGWSDDGFGAGHDIGLDLGPLDAGPDLHHG